MSNDQIADLNVSRETIAALEEFGALVRKWTKGINLISQASVNEVWERHIVDSAQIIHHVPAFFSHWVDLGSGGGFPGVVVAIIAKEMFPKARFTFIESDQRKATFLRAAVRQFDLPVDVMAQRIDAIAEIGADVVSARALTSLSDLMPLVQRHLSEDGIAILHKGKRYFEEIEAARAEWTFDLGQYPSITDPDARILTIQRIERA